MTEASGTARVAEVELKREYPDAPVPSEIVRRNVVAVRAAIFGLRRVKQIEAESRARPPSRVETTPDSTTAAPVGAGASAGVSQALSVDPFTSMERSGLIVPPPFDLLTLAVMPENNTELAPCIDAMAVNCDSFGYVVEPRVPVDDRASLAVRQRLLDERVLVENFMANCCDEGDAIEDLRDKVTRDLEATGNGYVQFVEEPGTGRLVGLTHLPSWTMRLGPEDWGLTPYMDRQLVKSVRLVLDPPEEDESEAAVEDESAPSGEEVVVRADPPNLQNEASEPKPAPPPAAASPPKPKRSKLPTYHEETTFEIREVLRFKRFRRYVHLVDRTTVVWFKELNDPRLISSLDGHVVTREELNAEAPDAESIPRFTLAGNRLVVRTGPVGFDVSLAANPLRHRRLYCTRSPYGLPRYQGHLFCVFGSRAAEEINFTTFKNNNIPSAVITVSNGKLDDESLERLDEFVEAAIQSDDNYSKFLLLEAEPATEGARDPGSMRIEVKPLTREQHTDALFVEYQKANDDRTRRAWRFAPIYVGVSGDWTGKTIDASRRLSEEQVFGPTRAKTDRFFDEDVLLRLGVANSRFRSLSPNVTENGDLIRMLATGEKTGTVTPDIAHQFLELVTNKKLPKPKRGEGFDPHVPFSLTLARVMKQAAAGARAAGGGEPTSQGHAGLQVAGPGRDRPMEPAAEALAEANAEIERRVLALEERVFEEED